MTNPNEYDLRESLAELCHNQWSGWMEYLFSKCDVNEDGNWIIPRWAAERWQRQMTTLYEALPGSEQENDRKQADKFLALLESCLLDGCDRDMLLLETVDLKQPDGEKWTVGQGERWAIGRFVQEVLQVDRESQSEGKPPESGEDSGDGSGESN